MLTPHQFVQSEERRFKTSPVYVKVVSFLADGTLSDDTAIPNATVAFRLLADSCQTPNSYEYLTDGNGNWGRWRAAQKETLPLDSTPVSYQPTTADRDAFMEAIAAFVTNVGIV